MVEVVGETAADLEATLLAVEEAAATPLFTSSAVFSIAIFCFSLSEASLLAALLPPVDEGGGVIDTTAFLLSLSGNTSFEGTLMTPPLEVRRFRTPVEVTLEELLLPVSAARDTVRLTIDAGAVLVACILPLCDLESVSCD